MGVELLALDAHGFSKRIVYLHQCRRGPGALNVLARRGIATSVLQVVSVSKYCCDVAQDPQGLSVP